MERKAEDRSEKGRSTRITKNYKRKINGRRKQKTMRIKRCQATLKRLKQIVVGEKTKAGEVVTNKHPRLAVETAEEEKKTRVENDAATKRLSLAM